MSLCSAYFFIHETDLHYNYKLNPKSWGSGIFTFNHRFSFEGPWNDICNVIQLPKHNNAWKILMTFAPAQVLIHKVDYIYN